MMWSSGFQPAGGLGETIKTRGPAMVSGTVCGTDYDEAWQTKGNFKLRPASQRGHGLGPSQARHQQCDRGATEGPAELRHPELREQGAG